MAEEVFSQEIKDLVIPKLESPGFIDSLQDELLELFSVSVCVYQPVMLMLSVSTTERSRI